MEPIRSIISGPLNKGDESLNVGICYNESHWDISNISFDLPEEVVYTVKSIFINPNSGNLDKMVWNQTDSGLFSTKIAYTLIGSLNH